MMRVHDSRGILILKAPTSQNKTIKIELNLLKHNFLATTTTMDEWLGHYRFGHLNFRYINHLKKKNMVSSLPKIQIPSEVYEECGQAKQHKNSFSNDAGSNSKGSLEVIYSDVCSLIQVDSIESNWYFVIFIYDFSKKIMDIFH